MATKKTRKKPAKKTAKKTATKTAKKKSTAKRSRSVSVERDKATSAKIVKMVEGVAKSSLAQADPFLDIPVRSVSNMKFNTRKRILEMGENTQRRTLFNVRQARKFMQGVLLSKGCKELIEADKTLSLRGMYYMSLHTIEGTSEKTFNEQSESDGILEDLEVTIDGLREELHVFAKKRGTMVGNITVIDNGELLNRRGSLNVDDEGTIAKEKVLIENGILKGYMQDRQNARLMGVDATGNGRRESYAHAPMPRMTNTYMPVSYTHLTLPTNREV